ncbi:hypothetical protein SLA2020_305430 [Shorea laevis]
MGDSPIFKVPIFEQCVDNIIGIVYTMDLLDFVQKGEQPESSTVGDIAHKPAYLLMMFFGLILTLSSFSGHYPLID